MNTNDFGFGWLVVFAVTSICVNCGPSVAQDRVYPVQGVMASGKFVDVSPKGVVIEVRGKNQNYELRDIRKLTFDGEPKGLDRARESFLNEQFDQALEEIKKIDVAQIESALIRQDVEFYRYYCEGKLGLAGSGDKTAAVKGLLALARANRNTHHLYELSGLLGELALALGKPEEAANYFGMLASAPNADTKAVGIYQLGQVELAQDNVDKARARFEQLASAESKSPEMARLKALSEVGLAVCENLEGNPEAAIQKLDALISKSDSTDQELFARISNAMGGCYQKLDKPQQALVLGYLKTDLMFFTEPEAHAEALYNLKQLWARVGDSARAADAGARLVSQYAASAWANK